MAFAGYIDSTLAFIFGIFFGWLGTKLLQDVKDKPKEVKENE